MGFDEQSEQMMRHIFLVPKLSWYLAPSSYFHAANPEHKDVGHLNIKNEDGKEKYEFWIKGEKDGFTQLVREYNNGDRLDVEVMTDQFEFEDFNEKEEDLIEERKPTPGPREI